MKGGFVSIYKPVGISSFKALASVKKYFNTKKVGHLGTLDPWAEGILPVAVDEATKLIPYIETEPKVYEVEIYFGQESITLDREGVDMMNLGKLKKKILKANLTKVLNTFIGTINQVPPKYSAVKVDGSRAYDLARAGEDFNLASKLVKVFDIKVLNYNWPILKLRVECGSGFYVRSLVRDIGQILEVPCFMYSLIRKSVGAFDISNSFLPDSDFVLMDESNFLKNALRIDFTKDDYELIRKGLPVKSKNTGLAYGYFEGKLFCVLDGDGSFLKVKKNLLL